MTGPVARREERKEDLVFHSGPSGARFLSVRRNAALALLFLLAGVAGLSARPQPGSTRQAGESRPDPGFWKLPAAVQPMPAALGSRELLDAPSRALVQSGADAYCTLMVEFSSPAAREAFRAPGVTVYSAFQQFADVFVPGTAKPEGGSCDEAAIKAIYGAPGLLGIQYGRIVQVEPPPLLKRGAATRAVPEEVVRGGIAGVKGKGVILVVFDSGLDFRNPDFITYDAAGRPTSRLLYLWDPTSNAWDTQKLGGAAPFSYPNGASLGTLYTREQLTAELRSAGPRIPITDEDGHGTGVAGVAAGNGNNARGKGYQYIGVAPEADIIAVRNGWSYQEYSFLLNAVIGWVDQVAQRAGEPVVFNCSCIFDLYGDHDGNSVQERQLNARFADNVRGRAIVISAGNEQLNGYHSRKRIADRSRAAQLVWAAPKDGGVLRLYVRNADGTAFDGQDLVLDGGKSADGKPLDLSRRWAGPVPLSNDHLTALAVPGGWSGVWLWSKSGKDATVDAYVAPGAFDIVHRSPENTVGLPGMARQAITAGSYDWNDQFDQGGQKLTVVDVCGGVMRIGELSCYSSVGPGRDPSFVKPDIVSPGQWFTASYAKQPNGQGVNAPHPWSVDTSGNYVLFNGTSASAPYTSGIVALMLEKKPALTVGEIRGLLHKYATQDSYTGKTPNPSWGYGKLDLGAVRAILNAIR